jgi:hypothetical protein
MLCPGFRKSRNADNALKTAIDKTRWSGRVMRAVLPSAAATPIQSAKNPAAGF